MLPAANTSKPRKSLPLAALLVLGGGCGRQAPVVETLQVLGGETTIEIRGMPVESARSAIAESSRQLGQLEREWHAWEPSDLTRINVAFAKGETAKAPASILQLIKRSQQLHGLTNGLYDPGVGGLVELWGFHTSTFPVTTPAPSSAQVAAWRASATSVMDISVKDDQVSSRNTALALDFAAIAEGASAEQVSRLLRDKGVRHALITMGGDVVALGDGDGQPWRVDLVDPFGGVLGNVELRDGEGFFTSGLYNKFRRAPNGGRWGNVLNPRTGMPAQGTAAVAVLHPDAVLADAASTALMAGGPASFAALASRMKLGCALLLTEENELLVTTGMQARFKLLRHPVPLGEPLDLGPDCDPR